MPVLITLHSSNPLSNCTNMNGTTPYIDKPCHLRHRTTNTPCKCYRPIPWDHTVFKTPSIYSMINHSLDVDIGYGVLRKRQYLTSWTWMNYYDRSINDTLNCINNAMLCRKHQYPSSRECIVTPTIPARIPVTCTLIYACMIWITWSDVAICGQGL